MIQAVKNSNSIAFNSAILLAVLIFAGLLPGRVFAEPVTLEQMIGESLSKNSGIYRAQRDYDEKLASASETKTIDNPELNADAIRRQGDGGTGVEIELIQPLKYSQISGARARFANALTQAAGIEQKFEILKVINETTTLFIQLWLHSERKKLYASYAADADRMQKLVGASASQGQTSPAAAQLFTADAAKLRADAVAVDAEVRRTRTDLMRLTGRNMKTAELQRPIFSPIPAELAKLTGFATSRSNMRNILQARVRTAERRFNVAEQDAVLPEFGPRVLYSRSPDGEETSYGIGVTLRIPLWSRNEAERARATAELRQAQRESDLLARAPSQDIIRDLQENASGLQARADSYFSVILPGYRKSYQLTQAMFRQGQANAFDVWQVREKLLASENEALDAMAQAVTARGALELELGGKIEEIQ
jgi:outer membrane protein TolC